VNHHRIWGTSDDQRETEANNLYKGDTSNLAHQSVDSKEKHYQAQQPSSVSF
jgi:hypothetical protein